ncbi:hypothetical protein Clacol_010534 [Clathrus columnatus]|uniref:Decapping nuclease n=1 Tax=Clathrus columnatus TaxID=1419009 RepID=A0AAV5ATA8_9AGAM|nr:hypothetical protein Clacol_010534 [Clathrus columnatus]
MTSTLKRPWEDDETTEGNINQHSRKRRINGDLSILPLLKSSTSSPPSFQQPSQLLSFSNISVPCNVGRSETDKDNLRERRVEWSNASMKYYISPPLGANLAYGYKRWIRKPEGRERLDTLLQACSRLDLDAGSECRTRIQAERQRADVITWRGIGTKLLIAPYEGRDSWELNVMQVDGTIYLEEHSNDDIIDAKYEKALLSWVYTDTDERRRMSAKQQLMMYYGYAFESYCTTHLPPNHRKQVPAHRSSEGWGDEAVDTHVQWCSVVKTKLGDHRLILGDKYTGQPDTFVELKTSISIRPGNRGDESNFERKLLKFYFQSFLLGVPEIVVGFRSPNGYIQNVQTFRTLDLPRIVRGKPNAWNPSLCLTWGESVITFLKREIRTYRDNIRTQLPKVPNSETGDSEGIVWRLTFTPGVNLSLRVLDQKEAKEVVNDEDRVGFLPRWYWDHLKDARELPERAVPTNSQARANLQQADATAHSSSSSSRISAIGWTV